ncbi:MAG: response regulator [Limisphaerales bacterium]
MPKLVVLTGNAAGLSHELSANLATIGRAEGNTFQIADSSISGRHCEILRRGQEIIVSDLNSTNGTFVKGERISKAVLRAGQILRLGNVELRLEASGPAKSGKPAKPAKAAGQTGTGTTPAKKHQVLFVDDDQAFLEAITELYSILGDQTWKIHRAATADQALSVMQQTAIDLVVLDIGMPVLDGMQLLSLIHRRYPDVAKAILTGSAAAGNRETCLANGAGLFIHKPLSSEGMKAVFTTLNELISWAQSKGFSGMLRQVGLPDVIQMECLGRHSSILEVRNQRLHGQIYIETGAIVHATAGALTGEKAFYRLVSLTGGEFRLQPFKIPPERTVHGQWEFLLMEAARVHDEEATTMISKSAVTGQTATSTPASIAPGTEFHAVGENVIEMVGRGGKWHPADGAKKT